MDVVDYYIYDTFFNESPERIMEKILDKFLRYVSFDTQSCEESESQPSTAKQLKLLSLLRDELQQMGMKRNSRVLPPAVVRFIAEKFSIDIEP